MRNTFVKLFLALAVCFMIGSALVACGSSSFELTVSEDGYFVVNGEKTDIKQGDSVEDCAHEVEKFEVKAHTADADGVVLEVCTKCDDYAKVTAGTIHNYVDGEIAATCTAAGFKGEICSICGDHGVNGTEIEAAGHKYGEDVILTSIGYACEDGGVAVKHCSVCKYVTEPEAIGPVGHVVKNWITRQAPSVEVGYVYGDCQYCGFEKELELPALNDEDYSTSWKDNKAPTCYEKGTKVYAYIVKDEINNEVDNIWDKNVNLVVDGEAKEATHVIAGKAYTEWLNVSKNACDYYADVNGDGKVEAVGFRETALAGGGVNEIPCDTVGTGYFVCEACNYAVVDVPLYKAHFGAETIVEGKTAACHTPGLKKVACVNCIDINPDGVQVEYTVDHNIEYELVPNGEAWNLVGKCHAKKLVSAEGQPADYDECWELAGSTGKIEKIGVVAKKVGTTKSTCYKLGYDTYQCDYEVSEGVFVTVKANVNHNPLEQPEHTLNGKLFSEYEEAGEVNTALKGILPVAGGKFEVCGTSYKACYVCDVCAAYSATIGNTMGTLVVLDYEIEMPHSDIIVDNDDAEDATCLTAGKKFVKCVNAMCPTKGVEREETIPALGHDYVATIDVDSDADEIVLKAACSRACNEKYASVETIVALSDFEAGLKNKSKSKATCTTLAIDSYSGTLAFKVVDAYGNSLSDLDKFVFDKDDEGNWIYNIVVEVAVKKDKGTGFVQSDRVYDFINIAYEKKVGELKDHNWCDAEDYQTTVFNRDSNKDGVIDGIETYTFKYCVDCFAAEQVGDPEVEMLTDDYGKEPEEE